jgi:hypothetical protein
MYKGEDPMTPIFNGLNSNGQATRRWLPLFLMILAVASLGLVACQAAMETKQGGLGEFCNNRDSDCRPGYICENSVCVVANQLISDACQQVCDRISNCGVTEGNCITDCQAELGAFGNEGNWADEAVEVWSDCVVNDLSCAEIGDTPNDAAEVCYRRLPLDETRADRCESFVNEGRACNSGELPDGFQSECIYRARTHSDERWELTDECAEAAEFGNCSEFTGCLNTTFSLPEEARF